MKKVYCIFTIMVISLAVFSTSFASSIDMDALAKSSYYSYDAIEKKWVMAYEEPDCPVCMHITGDKDGNLEMPIEMFVHQNGTKADTFVLVIGDKLYRADKTISGFLYFAKQSEPLLDALREAESVIVRSYAGYSKDTQEIVPEKYETGLKKFIEEIYSCGIVKECMNQNEAGFMYGEPLNYMIFSVEDYE